MYSDGCFNPWERLGCKNRDVSTSHLDLVEEKVFESLKALLQEYKLDTNKSTKNLELSSSIENINNQIIQLNLELKKADLQKSKLYDFLEQRNIQ